MFRKLSPILGIGNSEDTPKMEEFRTFMVNLMSILTSSLILLYVLVFLNTARFSMAVVYLIFSGLAMLPIALNKYGYYTISRILIILIMFTINYSIVFMVGFQAQSLLLIVIIMAGIPLLFDNLKIVISHVVGIVALIFFSHYYLNTNGPLYPEVIIKYSHLINFSFAILSATIFSLILLNQVRRYIIEIQKSNDLLLKNNTVLVKKNEQIELQNKRLELFTSVASHDLRTPLRTISSFTGLIERKLQKKHNPDSDLNEYLHFIKTGSRQMNDLVNSISTVHSLQHSNAEEKGMIDLNALLQELQIHFNKEMNSQIEIKAEKLPKVNADKIHFFNIFQNLIENSRKYNNSEIKKLNISSSTTDNRFHLIFEDNGIGIEDIYIDQIFQPFKKLHSNVEYEGSGMGLAICKRIIEMYEGNIKVKSTKSEGSVFTIDFPLSILN